jgi:hypothetical protein
MVEHPHLEAMKAQMARHKFAYMGLGVVAGVCVAGGITAAVGASSMKDENDAITARSQQQQSVNIMGGDASNPSTRGWFTSSAESQESSDSNGFCWSCDNAPSRGWKWNFGYGKCHCEPNWEGACCDTPLDITKVTHGPYMGTPGTYELTTFHTKDTASAMVFPDENGDNADGTSVPPEFAGLWWMDGNPASDYVASFGRSNWQSVADDGYVCQNAKITNSANDEEFNCLGGMDIPVYDDSNWSWHDEALGHFVYGAVLGVQLTYTFECGGDDGGKLTYCQVYPNAAIPVTAAGSWISVPPSLVSFDMTRAGDDLWIRNSYIAGLDSFPHNYYLKRITMGDGSEGEHWDDYMSHGHNPAPSVADVFGNGADERETVSDVHATQCLGHKLSA